MVNDRVMSINDVRCSVELSKSGGGKSSDVNKRHSCVTSTDGCMNRCMNRRTYSAKERLMLSKHDDHGACGQPAEKFADGCHYFCRCNMFPAIRTVIS